MRAVILMIMVFVLSSIGGSTNTYTTYHYDGSRFIEVYTQYCDSIKLVEEYTRRSDIINAIIKVESSGNSFAFNTPEQAVGVLQIRPIMLREINRLVGYTKYTLHDRWDRDKSIQMFIDYQNHVNPEWDYELASRRWNGGHYGHYKAATISYWVKVQHHLKN